MAGLPRRHGIIAGNGRIPLELAEHLSARGDPPFIFIIDGEGDSQLTRFDHCVINPAEVGKLVRTAKAEGVTHMTLVGGVRGRPAFTRFRPDSTTLRLVPRIIRALMAGDDHLLSEVVTMLEERGFMVVGVDAILTDMVADPVVMTRKHPDRAAHTAIDIGLRATQLLGQLDAGQAGIVIGKRVVALEGVEGTDAMLQRVADMKTQGRLAARRGGVLVKTSKPGQELRVDMPTIGVHTVRNAANAQLAGIAVEAGKTLIVDRPAVIEAANAAGLFVVGVELNGKVVMP